jgi:hypothetical protein
MKIQVLRSELPALVAEPHGDPENLRTEWTCDFTSPTGEAVEVSGSFAGHSVVGQTHIDGACTGWDALGEDAHYAVLEEAQQIAAELIACHRAGRTIDDVSWSYRNVDGLVFEFVG